MRFLILFLLLGLSSIFAHGKVSKDCTFKGKSLNGKVKIVEYGEDFKVKVVSALEDLKVQQVDNWLFSECGKWQFMNNGMEDFKVKFVEFGEDFTIRFVTVLPGVP